MKVIDYLFFKFYKFWQRSSISEISTYAAILLLSVTCLVRQGGKSPV